MESRLKDLEQKLQQVIEENLLLKNELAKIRERSSAPPLSVPKSPDNVCRIPEYRDWDSQKARHNHWNCDSCGTSNYRYYCDECGRSKVVAATNVNKILDPRYPSITPFIED